MEGEPKTLTRRRLKVGMSGFPRSLDPVIATDTAIRRTMPQFFETMPMIWPHGPAWPSVRSGSMRSQCGCSCAREWLSMKELSLTAEDVAFSLGPDHLLGPGRRGMSQALQSLDRSRKSNR